MQLTDLKRDGSPPARIVEFDYPRTKAATVVYSPGKINEIETILSVFDAAFASNDRVIHVDENLLHCQNSLEWIDAALEAYANEPGIMSIAGMSIFCDCDDRLADPHLVFGSPGPFLFGTWRNAWSGMEESWLEMIARMQRKGIDPEKAMGARLHGELRNEEHLDGIFPRFMAHHILNGGYALHPPRPLAHLSGPGFTESRTKTTFSSDPVPIPASWPKLAGVAHAAR